MVKKFGKKTFVKKFGKPNLVKKIGKKFGKETWETTW